MQTEPRCPHCDEVVEPRWDVCRYCGKAIRVAKPPIPSWAWVALTIVFITVGILTGRQLLKGGVGSCKGSDKPGCAEALQTCALATKHDDALEKGGSIPRVLQDVRRAESLAKVARAKGGVRYTSLPIYSRKLVVVLSKPGARLPLTDRDRTDYRYFVRACEAIA